MAAIGIHAHYSAADHTLLLTGLSVSTVVNGAWHWQVQALYAHGLIAGHSQTDGDYVNVSNFDVAGFSLAPEYHSQKCHCGC